MFVYTTLHLIEKLLKLHTYPLCIKEVTLNKTYKNEINELLKRLEHYTTQFRKCRCIFLLIKRLFLFCRKKAFFSWNKTKKKNIIYTLELNYLKIKITFSLTGKYATLAPLFYDIMTDIEQKECLNYESK